MGDCPGSRTASPHRATVLSHVYRSMKLQNPRQSSSGAVGAWHTGTSGTSFPMTLSIGQR